MKEFKRYLSYIGKYKVSYWSIFVMTLITSVLLDLMYPYMNKLIFNALEYRDMDLFTQAVILCIVLLVLNCLSPYRRYFQIRVVRNIVFDIKIRLFEKLSKMDMDYFEKHHSAEALKTLNWDANSLKDSYFSHIYWVFGRLVTGVASILAMLVYSPIMALVSIGFCLVTVSVSIRINRQIKQMDRDIQRKVARLTARLSDILSGFPLLKMYRGSSIVLDSFQCENEQVAKEEKQKVKKLSNLEMASFLLGILASFGTIAVGAFLVSRGRIDYGTVMAIVSLQLSVSTMVQSFGSALTTFHTSLVRAGNVFDFLELDCEEPQGGKAVDLRTDCNPVEIESLTFSYFENQDVLKDFSLTVAEGEKIMIMGESGCGKSTLLKLLLRFYQNTSGKIMLYGHDIDAYPLWQLRQLITYIPQNSYLFEGSIRENIAFGYAGKGQVRDAEIVRAAKLAYAEEFIDLLPQKYDTHLDAGGSNLSGGQRQRIAIARAFLKDAPILLMDEPSSALDVQSEKMIHQALKELTKHKVVLMVTHRATSFEDFDRCVRM
ncbi:MAG: ABC transporter ATP-binding protein/permease [Lachnospiraceae bacterium]|jgi:ABC-type multidrug transport system, ATPase and permease components|nr:ABC transporter ATP-binding protein/permease [Lachnospiraceae bacterium]